MLTYFNFLNKDAEQITEKMTSVTDVLPGLIRQFRNLFRLGKKQERMCKILLHDSIL